MTPKISLQMSENPDSLFVAHLKLLSKSSRARQEADLEEKQKLVEQTCEEREKAKVKSSHLNYCTCKRKGV